jgi:iron(II)-dependent oxidoreductase
VWGPCALAAFFVAAVGAAEPIPGNPLVPIAAGSFVFGSNDGEPNERPEERIELPAFAINAFEITNAQYRSFAAASGHRPSFHDGHPVLGRPDHPVVGVTWDDAAAFCTVYGLALPSERQWERAARGVDGRLHPWGDGPATAERANRGAEACCQGSDADGFAMTAPVGSFPSGRSAEGVHDLIGNVWEWVDGWYNPYDARPAAREQEFRVLRGGAWNSDDRKLRATYRLAYRGDFRFAANGGFRCVLN